MASSCWPRRGECGAAAVQQSGIVRGGHEGLIENEQRIGGPAGGVEGVAKAGQGVDVIGMDVQGAFVEVNRLADVAIARELIGLSAERHRHRRWRWESSGPVGAADGRAAVELSGGE